MLEENPSALHLWPDRIECLIGLGRKADARAALKAAYAALKKSPRDLAWIRRRLDKLDVE
ncbi:MAG: hypothetical protein ACYTGN_12525 [Planctomycetota bacterium]